jgi:hypothetical protein
VVNSGKQAYDRIYRPTLWEILNVYGICFEVIEAIRVLYRNTEIEVKLSGFRFSNKSAQGE